MTVTTTTDTTNCIFVVKLTYFFDAVHSIFFCCYNFCSSYPVNIHSCHEMNNLKNEVTNDAMFADYNFSHHYNFLLMIRQFVLSNLDSALYKIINFSCDTSSWKAGHYVSEFLR